ncbi:MAG: membrane protein insertase YidC [Rubrivivax sp.]|nr:membrane protein insertase YidC [Rubrivivax sp.]
MTDMRRTLLWVVFTMSLVLLWDAWNKHNGQPGLFGGGRPQAAASAPGAAPNGVPTPTSAAAPAAAGTTSVPAGAAVAGAVAAAGERIDITTDRFKASFDSVGGKLVRLELLGYRDNVDRQRNVMLFDQSATRIYRAQTGLITDQAGVQLPTHHTPMTALPGVRDLAAGSNDLSLSFEGQTDSGVKLVKTFSFKRGSYSIGVKHEVINASAVSIKPQLYLQLLRDGKSPEGESSYYFTFTGPALYTETQKFQKLDFSDIDKGKAEYEKAADNGWVAMVQHYFTSAWLVPEKQQREFRAEKVGNNYAIAMVLPLGEVAAGAIKVQDAVLYAGPQLENKLAALAPGLELVKDYGKVHVIAAPLFWLLDKLHSIIGNWGWAIVALVVLLKIAFYWLNASAYKSMAKMKAINPKVTEMRERFKDEPQKMQQEMMRIYREEKVNPLGSCLPIFVQMPFFIALYWVLLSSVEMRNAPWIGWITDLADKDPWFILPVLMTLSSLFQVWLNPTPPDPMQAKMMWIMPLAFSFMFFFFPAGLVLYWLTNNVLSIAQQWFINKRLGVA